MEVIGKVKKVGEVVDVTASFKKRELVVTTEEQFPQHISINFIMDKCDLIDKLEIGQDVKVSINLRGREWNDKYFNDIQGWRVEKLCETK